MIKLGLNIKWIGTDFKNRINLQLRQEYPDIKTILNPRNQFKYNLTNPINIDIFQGQLEERGSIIGVEGDTGDYKSTSAIQMWIKQRQLNQMYAMNERKMMILKIKRPNIAKRMLEIKKEMDNGVWFNWDNIQYTNKDFDSRLTKTKHSLDYFIRDERSRDSGMGSHTIRWELNNKIEQQARKRVWQMIFCSKNADSIPYHFRLVSFEPGKVYDGDPENGGEFLFDCNRFLVFKRKARKEMIVGYYICKRLSQEIEDQYETMCKSKRVGDGNGLLGTLNVNEKIKHNIELVRILWDSKDIRDSIPLLFVKDKERRVSKDDLQNEIELELGNVQKLTKDYKRLLLSYLIKCYKIGGFEKFKEKYLKQ